MKTLYFSKQVSNEFQTLTHIMRCPCDQYKTNSSLSTMSSGINEETEELQEHLIHGPFDPNKYAITKTVAKGFLNIALLTSNAKQLKDTLSEGPAKNPFYEASITFASISILLQTTMAILAAFIGKEDINLEHHQEKATKLNRAIIILAIVTAIDNVLLAAFSNGPQHGY